MVFMAVYNARLLRVDLIFGAAMIILAGTVSRRLRIQKFRGASTVYGGGHGFYIWIAMSTYVDP